MGGSLNQDRKPDIRFISVADIDDPSAELNATPGRFNQLIAAYEVDAVTNQFTVYAFDAEDSSGANTPYEVASSNSGKFIAIAGKYNNTTPSGTVGGSGTANYLPKWTNSSTLGNSIVYESSDHIGIGNTDPTSARLEVKGEDDLNSSNTLYLRNNSDTKIARISNLNQIEIGNAASASSTFTTAIAPNSTASNTNALAVGYLATASGTSSGAFSTQATASGNDSLAAGRLATSSAQSTTSLGHASVASATQATAVGYSTEATGTNSGVFGVFGKTSANRSITIGSFQDAILRVDNAIADTLMIGFNSDTPTMTVTGGTGSTGTYGGVGFGITAPTATIHAHGVSDLSTDYVAKFENNSSSVILAVQNDAKVGINTDSPEQTLDVLGTIQARRAANATSGATLKNSNILQFQGAYWNGSSSVSVSMKMFSTVLATSPRYALNIADNSNDIKLTISSDDFLSLKDGLNISIGTTTGTRFGILTASKIGFWNAMPIVQPTTSGVAATFVANTSGIADDTATFDGYTIGKVVKAFRNMGLLT